MADKKVTNNDLFWTFIRSNFLLGSFNFERMQSMGFCVSMMPILKRVYGDNKEEMKAALKRHLEFFNTQPFVAAAIMGIIGAMEEKRANGADISPATLSGVKVGLIGPLAGRASATRYSGERFARFWRHWAQVLRSPAQLSVL